MGVQERSSRQERYATPDQVNAFCFLISAKRYLLGASSPRMALPIRTVSAPPVLGEASPTT